MIFGFSCLNVFHTYSIALFSERENRWADFCWAVTFSPLNLLVTELQIKLKFLCLFVCLLLLILGQSHEKTSIGDNSVMTTVSNSREMVNSWNCQSLPQYACGGSYAALSICFYLYCSQAPRKHFTTHPVSSNSLIHFCFPALTWHLIRLLILHLWNDGNFKVVPCSYKSEYLWLM